MLKPIREGYTVRIQLPEECGHKNYSVKCTYKYNKHKEKYQLSMWLKRNDIDDDFKIDSQEIDTQFITSSKETIENDICKIVEHASLSGYFDFYIQRFEYTYNCFKSGNESFEKRRLDEKDWID